MERVRLDRIRKSMGISKLILQNFRSYPKRESDLAPKTVIIGNNGSGKTNIVEAIYLLATGKSFRADLDLEMITYEEKWCVVSGEISGGDELKIVINDGEIRGAKKRFEVNGVGRRSMDFVGKLRAVLFAPQDLELITGSPGKRRRYLDFVISQIDREYRRCLVSYEKGLRQRNKLLDMIREGRAQRSQLYFWDRLLIKNGEYITLKRGEYLIAASTSPSVPLLNQEREVGINVFYDKSVISEARLKQYEHEEVMAATTLVGPHRDDFVVTQILNPKSQILNSVQNIKRDVSKFGSRGEQRMAVWWLKQCEISYLGGSPVLLLDDIFSELDHEHRAQVAEFVRNYSGQVIATEADEHLLPDGVEWEKIVLSIP